MTIDIQLTDHPTSEEDLRRILADPGFATHATDHMVVADVVNGVWGDLSLRPYKDFVLEPRTMGIHYGQEIFEGLKAFVMDDGQIVIFRPADNAQRFVRSAERMSMTPLPVEMFVEACEELVRVDSRWVPSAPGTSLYIRPFMFASEAHIGIRSAHQYSFAVIALPASPFFSSNFSAITVGIPDRLVRAAKGGTGEAKCAGNYAASLLAKSQLAAFGCSEAMWLDSKEHRYVEELSGMNLFFVEKAGTTVRLITPPLNGSILRGVTRDSLIKLANSNGVEVQEREIGIDEIAQRSETGEITEAFACGTAAVVAPIGRIRQSNGEMIVFGDGTSGEYTTSLYNELVSVQLGRSDKFPEWRYVVEGARIQSAA